MGRDADNCKHRAFTKAISTKPILTLYNPKLVIVVMADAFSFDLGAVLTQKQHNGEFWAVIYISWPMILMEQHIAQIEK